MIFLGKKVIFNSGESLVASSAYNLSIPDTVFLYYSGLSADAELKWSYSFSIDSATVVDTGIPELLDAYVDCNGDGNLVANSGVPLEDTCDTDGLSGIDFLEIQSNLKEDGSSYLPLVSQFKLYFKEKVQLKTGAKATLTADDGTAAIDLTTGSSSQSIAVGSGMGDCVVTLNPTLKEGRQYTLNVGSGQITDAATLKNPYGGTSFTFYTRLTSSSTFPTGSNIPKETLVKVTMAEMVRLGTATTDPYLEMSKLVTTGGVTTETGLITYLLTDPNAIKIQGNDILLIPQPKALDAGSTYSVKIPAHQVRYMTTDVSFQFSTRLEDITKPKVMTYGPSSSGIYKKTLDGTAGATAPSPAYPKVPYVLFTEGIEGAGKTI
jgi:hypothetical protein